MQRESTVSSTLAQDFQASLEALESAVAEEAESVQDHVEGLSEETARLINEVTGKLEDFLAAELNGFKELRTE